MSTIDEFIREVDNVYGLYLDCITGFRELEKSFIKGQEEVRKMLNLPTEEIDKRSFSYGKGDPNKPESSTLHQTTQGELKERIKKEGKDYYDIAMACLVFIYQYWEDYYRQEIAKENDVEKGDILWDIMGDIRFLRESIIHHQGAAKKDVCKCKILKGFAPDEKIFINEQRFEEIVNRIKDTTYMVC